MDEIKSREICEIVDVVDASSFHGFIERSAGGIRMVPEPYGPDTANVLKPDTGDFVKWIKVTRPDVTVEVERAKTLVLHSNEVWIPLAFLAKEFGLPLYLNLVSSYLYDRFKNALSSAPPRVHLSAEYSDIDGTVRRFNFEGDHDALKAAIKKFDLNKFLDQ
jgi:hypothetical protein